ncbi:MAG TPA: Gx transporter family protein [Gammaproteobacteria bacterium]|nr:Gx transporter family protein [Gammaproteobacteria bacterium]
MNQTLQTTRDDHLIAGFAALAITIHIAESALPSPLPGIKPGLANVVTLMVLCRYGWQMAAWVALLRVLVGSILIGTFLSPTFFLSAAGALASVGVLGLLFAFSRGFPRWAVSPLGFGVAAALAHMSGQFWLAYVVFVPHSGLLALYPLLMTLAAVLGVVSGLLTRTVLGRLKKPLPSTP